LNRRIALYRTFDIFIAQGIPAWEVAAAGSIPMRANVDLSLGELGERSVLFLNASWCESIFAIEGMLPCGKEMGTESSLYFGANSGFNIKIQILKKLQSCT
jgi:hypothetical protein